MASGSRGSGAIGVSEREVTLRTSVALVKDDEVPRDENLLRVAVTCLGTSPLLMNRMTTETLMGLRPGNKRPKSARPSLTPREEAEFRVYLDKIQNPYVPLEYLFSSLVVAGTYVRLDGKRQISTAKSTTLPAFVEFENDRMPILDPETGAPAPWEADIRQGRNPNGGEAVCVVRPRFDRWSFVARIVIDLREINEQKIRELFDIAGKRIGLGDFRPHKRGWFGKFCVQCWDSK